MNGSHSTQAPTFLNQTATQEALGQDMSASIHEFKVFNITLTTLALCILTVTGVLCSISLLRRRRQSKQARVYESAVGGFEASALPVTSLSSSSGESAAGEPSSGLAVLLRREVRCSLRRPLSALLRRREPPKDNSRIYYIYSNPLPVGKDEDQEEEEGEEEEREEVGGGVEEQDDGGLEEVEKRGAAVRAGGGEQERPLSLYELAWEPSSGITLNSETFYMQL